MPVLVGDATGERSFPLPMRRRRIAPQVLFTAHILRAELGHFTIYVMLPENKLGDGGMNLTRPTPAT